MGCYYQTIVVYLNVPKEVHIAENRLFYPRFCTSIIVWTVIPFFEILHEPGYIIISRQMWNKWDFQFLLGSPLLHPKFALSLEPSVYCLSRAISYCICLYYINLNLTWCSCKMSRQKRHIGIFQRGSLFGVNQIF